MSAPFLPYIHTFRAVAIIAVVVSHFDFPLDQLTFGERVALSLARDASVLFLFVAGFLFQYLSEGFSYVPYLKSKFLNVIIPYIVTSQPALVHQYYRHTGVFAAGFPRHFSSPVLHAGWALLTAAHVPAPLWFIPMISVLYLAAPILLAMDRRPRWYLTILPMLVVATFCHRPMPLNHIGHAVIYFTPVYLAGMWFSRYRRQILDFINRHLWVLWLVWAAIEAIDVLVLEHAGPIFSRAPFSTENGIWDLNLLTKLLFSFCLIGLLARYPNLLRRRLDYLASASFGVFFVHMHVMELIASKSTRWLHHPLPTDVRGMLFMVPIYVLGSLAVIAAVRAVAGRRSKYLIGC